MKVGVIGAGTMGSGIAQAFAQTEGYEVVLCDINEAFAEKGKEKIAKGLQKKVARGKLSEEEAEAIISKITTGLRDKCADCDLIVEAAFEDMAIKHEMFKELDTLCKPETIFATNTTSLSITEIGAGIPGYEIKDVITVVKAYSSAVGAGEFVSEIFGEEADELRKRGGDGGEFGATTGRPRRMGWFDAVASRYGCRVQGATEVALTVLDVLGYLDELPICIGYEIDGEVTRDFPTTRLLKKAKPVYTTLPGWKCDIRGITKYEDLPENCRNYIEFIEKELEVPITMVSNGPGRHEIIKRK